MRLRTGILKPIWLGALCTVLLASTPGLAQTAARGKACADEWKAMKAANQTAGKKYRDFRKECMARAAAGAPGTEPAAPPAAGAPGTQAPKARKASPGREAMIARERACGAEWKAAKAAGQIPKGQTWPKYWSECNKRKKAEGM